ncbi:MAG: nitroreductase family protein [Mediterranea sp.]|jgi:nitroreductase|nr:nitroreductase family protein [Mediterranea sp.]
MENLSELLKQRRSMRKFTDEELTQEQVVALLKAALMAPTSKGQHSWEFMVVDDKELLQQLSLCKAHGSQFIAEAPLAIVVAADPMVSEAWIEDASVASVLLQLQAEDMGLGSCWAQIRGRETPAGTSSEQYVRDLLNMPLNWQVVSIIAVGHKGMERKPFNEDNLLWEKVHVNKL